ncbi:hypothetical protein KRP22_005720 [Phytophthora ramorum]|uniref:uncharacterized protein n=1 Tax=Phytophthora ramorum TaxID=164328 RepID=UPI0030952704|nr:hypothetical protein KRP23_3615 [Phytophthora ramorum]KAH7508057.1 hypothetical protein KRP22_3148 [Phytophthora ramorum]
MMSKDAEADRKKKSSVEHHDLISPLHSQYEEELDRIRTEGDLALIKVQTERKRLVELETKLAEANKQLRERKKTGKQVEQSVEVKESAVGKGMLGALVLSIAAGAKGAVKQLPTIPQTEKEQESNVAKRPPINAAGKERQLQTEERLKVAVAERSVELQKLRNLIDETRRKRLDALANEKEMLEDIQEAEEDVKRAQTEAAELKRRAVEMKSEIAATELEFDTEKQAFRLERQRLLVQVEEIVKAEKQGSSHDPPAPVSHKYSMFHNNIAHRRTHVSKTSKWKKVTLEQKIVSFEQKKRLLDRIIEETSVKTLSEFIHKYNEQECTKAEVFAQIEAQTAANEALNESIAQLTDDIARLSGASENDSTGDDAEKPSELQKHLDIDEVHIKRWAKDADIFTEAVKFLRDPIHDIYKEFFSNERNEDVLNSVTIRGSGMMRRIGAVEERIMQFIMAKILEETEASSAPNSSDTLRRLRQYQGRREQQDSVTLPLSKLYGVEPPSTIKSGINAHRSKDSKAVPEEDEDEDDDDDPTKKVIVMHSDVFRQKFNAVTSSDSAKNTTGGPPSSSPTRKNATTTLNL